MLLRLLFSSKGEKIFNFTSCCMLWHKKLLSYLPLRTAPHCFYGAEAIDYSD